MNIQRFKTIDKLKKCGTNNYIAAYFEVGAHLQEILHIINISTIIHFEAQVKIFYS